MWFPRLGKTSRHSKYQALSEGGGLLLFGLSLYIGHSGVCASPL